MFLVAFPIWHFSLCILILGNFYKSVKLCVLIPDNILSFFPSLFGSFPSTEWGIVLVNLHVRNLTFQEGGNFLNVRLVVSHETSSTFTGIMLCVARLKPSISRKSSISFPWRVGWTSIPLLFSWTDTITQIYNHTAISMITNNSVPAKITANLWSSLNCRTVEIVSSHPQFTLLYTHRCPDKMKCRDMYLFWWHLQIIPRNNLHRRVRRFPRKSQSTFHSAVLGIQWVTKSFKANLEARAVKNSKKTTEEIFTLQYRCDRWPTEILRVLHTPRVARVSWTANFILKLKFWHAVEIFQDEIIVKRRCFCVEHRSRTKRNSLFIIINDSEIEIHTQFSYKFWTGQPLDRTLSIHHAIF